LRGIDRKAALANPAVVIETIVEEDRAHVFRQLDLGAQSLQPVEIDYRVRSAHGVRWMRTTALPRKQDGSVLWTGHWNDVTDKVQMQQAIIEARDEAERASDAKSAFLATVSHEIRTPMNGVIGLLELLAMSQLQEEQQNTLDVVRDSARSLLRIIDDILDFSKIDAGKFDLHPEPASVRALVERVRTMYAGNASVKHLVLRSEVDAAIAAAHLMDPLRLGQILNNLVNNAIKFTEHGEVELRAELAARDEGHELIRFVVRDTGPGLGEDEQKRLFMPFTQGATPARVGGTGLGLAISKRLAELMGGELTLQSEPGMGTTLTLAVRLPVCDDRLLKSADPGSQPERLLPRPPPEPARALEERTYLLLVDDHPVNLMLLKRQANALGYAAETVDNASAALDRWSTVRFAAIITDVNMPGMDGCELARRIRSIEEATARPRTPIIACTANALRGEAENCLQAGMDDYLPKPVQLGQLGEKLAYWVPLPDSPIHAKGMNELTEGDASLERRLLELFDEHCIHDLRALEDAFESGDDEELVHAAHRMKGAASTIAAVALARSCEAIELAAREGARARARAHLADVREQLARVRRHVAERVRGAPGRHDARTGGGA
jgi:signal transduction histidine kinase/CheY-like chemotaxis protein